MNVNSKGDSGGATVKVGEGGVHVGTWKPGGGTTVDVGEEGVNANTSHEVGGGEAARCCQGAFQQWLVLLICCRRETDP